MTNGEQQLIDAGFGRYHICVKGNGEWWTKSDIDVDIYHNGDIVITVKTDYYTTCVKELQAIATRAQELNEKERTE